jgi:hypothetical protein
VLQIPCLERNIIYVSEMNDIGVHTIFENDSCKMVEGVMILMRGARTRTLYKLLGSVDSTGYNNIVVLETNSIVPCLVN